MSAFYAQRLSAEAAEEIQKSDVCVFVGARTYEMAQGLNRPAYFMFAVCKAYSESVTGFPKESGALIFLKQNAGDVSFAGFEARAVKRETYLGYTFPVAEFTARQYDERLRKNT